MTAATQTRRSRWLAQLDGWLFADESAARVRMTRLLLASVIGARIALGPYRGLAGQPPGLFRPVWFLRLLDEMPSLEVIIAIQVVGVLGAALAVIGWRERWAFAAAWASLLVLGGLRASRGKVMHNDVLLVLVAGVFVFAPLARGLLDRRRGAQWGWPVRTSLVVVAGGYFFAGYEKVVSSGPAWVLSDNMRNVLYRAATSGRAPTDTVALYIADRPLLAHLAAFATLVIELGFVAILFRPRVRPWFVVASVVLHGSIYLTHGLDYSMWVAVVAIVLVDWSRVLLRPVDEGAT